MSGLSHMTYRELLANRALARKRQHRSVKAHRLVDAIDAELERRRDRKWSRIHAGLPPIKALDR